MEERSDIFSACGSSLSDHSSLQSINDSIQSLASREGFDLDDFDLGVGKPENRAKRARTEGRWELVETVPLGPDLANKVKECLCCVCVCFAASLCKTAAKTCASPRGLPHN